MENLKTTGNPKHKIKYLWDNKVHFKCKDPYGFWEINLDKGAIPASLNGSFTSYDYALKAATIYYKNKNEQLTDTPVEKPTIQYKKEPKGD